MVPCQHHPIIKKHVYMLLQRDTVSLGSAICCTFPFVLLLGYNVGVAWVLYLPPPHYLVNPLRLPPYVLLGWFVVICTNEAV